MNGKKSTPMRSTLRQVSELPLSAVWNDQGCVSSERVRNLTQEDIRQLMQAGPIRFVIATVGHPLRWISNEEAHVFWKLEVRPHLVAEPHRPFDVYSFPEGYCYIASEWHVSDEANATVALERHQ